MSLYHQKPHIYPKSLRLYVQHVDRMTEFYEEIIGLRVLSYEKDQVILTADGENELLSLEKLENEQKRPFHTEGLYHFALLLPSRSDLANFLKHIQDHQLNYGASDHYVSEAIYINDPEGNGIEIYCDRPSIQWDWLEEGITMETAPLNQGELLKEITKPWGKIPEKTNLGHLHLQVKDLESVEKFYEEGLGFKVMTRYPGAVFMATGGYHHHIACNQWQSSLMTERKENEPGLKWFSIIYPDEEARMQAIKRLKELQKKVINEDHEYITYDPAGNKIRLII